MSVEWNSEEVNHDYPLHWNKGPFHYAFTETEERIIERARNRWLDKKKDEPMMPRERTAKNWVTGEPHDRLPISNSAAHNGMPRIFDGFTDPPQALTQRDMEDFPNLDFIGQLLWFGKFLSDLAMPYNFGFGEEMVTRKFRLIDNGPPLAVEPFVRTIADAEWFLNNVPDPAIRSGCWPIYYWETQQLAKRMPEMPQVGSCCGGQITMTGFLRGIRNFVMDVRNGNMEMVELLLKGTTEYLKKKIDIMSRLLVQEMDASGQGHFLFWCDSTSYLSVEEMTKLLPYTYDISIPYAAEKGFGPTIPPEGPLGTHENITRIMNENVGGAINGYSEHPSP